MGTFGGHVLPGSFFIIFSLWWTVNVFSRYYSSLLHGKKSYVSMTTYPCPCLCGRFREWEVEGLVKIVFTAIGFTLEIITAMPEALVLSFAAEGILFKYHLMDRDQLDILIHTLLVWVIFLTVLVLVIEMRFRDQVLVSLTRAYLVLVQGTWFWQIAFILYNPLPHSGNWDPDKRDHLLMSAMIFAWHMAVDFIVMLVIGVIIASYHRRNGASHHHSDEEGVTMNLIKQDHNGRAILKLADSDSDFEYEKTN
ncbi:hypothetical protein LSH36_280g03004 [Paralvinella palmiformis]|uniref:Transmembrane protein 45B n=1 Tax=Paralvinella palmiformis TaxID=53620 RepID=A0AAD9JJQ6_9ANNE|nr:hypothetical protein LSH36_280g03004 [Paralvinella palmiformis]